MTKILVLVTNHPTLGTTNEKNGTYAPELTHAIAVFENAGATYQIASINGGAAPLYGEDIEDGVNEVVLANETFQAHIQNTAIANELDFTAYDAIFYPGGFGLLSDLAENTEVAAKVAAEWEAGKVVGAVCHGPAGLLPITLSNGEKLIADKHVTSFSREEESDFGTLPNVPFVLEESLARSAGVYSKVAPWKEYVVTDGKLVTGQNPASAHAVGEQIIALLNA